MAIQGKIFGGLLGFLVGGPAGALLGGLAGHQLDLHAGRKAGAAGGARSVQEAFFRVTFQAMGHVAKADGRVSVQEIEAARHTMSQFGLGPAETRLAIDLFTAGKARDFPLDAALAHLKAALQGRPDLARMFVQIQLQAALWGGALQGPGRAVLERICRGIGLPLSEFKRMEAMLRMQQPAGETPAQRSARLLADAYEVLGVDAAVPDADIKKAYRRLMNQNHPDKLVARGLPESMLKLAEERTRQVRAAYEHVCEVRGMR